MTIIDPSPRIAAPRISPSRRLSRLPRPYTIAITGGMAGVMRVATTLSDMGYRVPDFSVDIHEGVSCSCVRCTVALTSDECDEFAALVRLIPGVQSVEPS